MYRKVDDTRVRPASTLRVGGGVHWRCKDPDYVLILRTLGRQTQPWMEGRLIMKGRRLMGTVYGGGGYTRGLPPSPARAVVHQGFQMKAEGSDGHPRSELSGQPSSEAQPDCSSQRS